MTPQATDRLKPLGTFRAFYRHTALPSNWLPDMPIIEGESELPGYLFENSFPYRKQHPKENCFTNGYNAVRLLGGWDEPPRSSATSGQTDTKTCPASSAT